MRGHSISTAVIGSPKYLFFLIISMITGVIPVLLMADIINHLGCAPRQEHGPQENIKNVGITLLSCADTLSDDPHESHFKLALHIF